MEKGKISRNDCNFMLNNEDNIDIMWYYYIILCGNKSGLKGRLFDPKENYFRKNVNM